MSIEHEIAELSANIVTLRLVNGILSDALGESQTVANARVLDNMERSLAAIAAHVATPDSFAGRTT